MILPALVIAFASLASAQTAVVETGDAIPGIGTVTRIDDLAVNSAGDWMVRVDTSAPASRDLVILENGAVKFQEGRNTGLTSIPGALLVSCDTMAFNDNGQSMYLLTVRLSNGSNQVIVLWDDLLVLEVGVTPFNAPGAPAGAVWGTLREVWLNSGDQLLIGGRLISGEDLLARLTLDAAGTIVTEELIALEGTTLPTHTTPIEGFAFTRRRYAINASGSVIWYVDDETFTPGGMQISCCDNWVYRDSLPLLHEGDPMATMTINVVGSLTGVELDLNDAGDWLAQMSQDPGIFDQDILLKNGIDIIAEEGQTVPGFPGGYVITSLGSTTGAFLSSSGDVVWFGEWDNPNPMTDSGIFLNHELLVEEGVSRVNGVRVVGLTVSEFGMDVSRDGAFLLCELTLENGVSGAYLYDVIATIGTSYCGPAVPNSTGLGGAVTGGGSLDVARNYVVVTAIDLPLDSFGYFLAGQARGFVANAGGSQGTLCIGGGVGRFVGPGQIMTSGTTGTFALSIDLTQMPQPTGSVAVQPGETWNLQAWFRDAVGGGAVSNFTDGLELRFL